MLLSMKLFTFSISAGSIFGTAAELFKNTPKLDSFHKAIKCASITVPVNRVKVLVSKAY